MCGGGGGGGGLFGGGIGSIIGGIVGSIVPGIGTMAGAAVGGLLGGLGGAMINNDFAPQQPKINTNVEIPADQGLATQNMSSGQTGAKVALGRAESQAVRTGGTGAGSRTGGGGIRSTGRGGLRL